MDMESWLDGYDRRKHDLLGWLRDGGETVSDAGDMVSELERVLGGIRSLVQAQAAAADLARLDDVLGDHPAVGEAAPDTVLEVPAAPPVEAAPASEAPAAAEGILKSLSWMDTHTPESVPEPATRSRTAARPAALDFLGAPSGQDTRTTESPVEAPPPSRPAVPEATAPAPVVEEPAEPSLLEPSPVVPASVEPTFLEPSPVVPTPLEPTPLEPAPVDPAPVDPAPAEPSFDEPAPVAQESAPEAPATDPCPHFDPAPMAGLTAREALASVVEEPPPPPISTSALEDLLASAVQAPAAVDAPEETPVAPPRRTQRPILIECPRGEERRAALQGVGAGPDAPYLLHAVVEVPRGGGTGYVYNDPKDVFIVVDHPGTDEEPSLGHVAYGFVPDTVSDDGAHLDAFVLSSGAAGPGEMLRVRPLGYLRRADGDHKLFCVPEKHRAQVMADIPDTVLKACETWRNPTGVTGGTWCDAGKARELIRRCEIA